MIPQDIKAMKALGASLIRKACAFEAAGKIKPSLSMAEILAGHAGRLNPDALRGPCRARMMFTPRAKAMLAMKREGYSCRQIGEFFNRDHTSVIHACNKAKLWERLDAAR